MSRLAGLLNTKRPLVMGILNVTPDSFSDGGCYMETNLACDHALRMAKQGADIIDIGGESTRPGASPVSVAEELGRVLPVIRTLRQRSDVAISLDSSKTEVMAEAVAEDIDLINDVRALREEGAAAVVARAGLPVCLMHMQGEPVTMQDSPDYDDLVTDILAFFAERVSACTEAGIARDRIILDIGFGFGKTPEQNLILVNRLPEFSRLGLPLLVGLSRKSTIGRIVADRVIGSIGGALAALDKGARIIRTHDVGQTVAAIRVWRSITEERILDPVD